LTWKEILYSADIEGGDERVTEVILHLYDGDAVDIERIINGPT